MMTVRSFTALRVGALWLFAVSSFGGIPCGAEDGDDAAMECCRGDMKDCNMPDKTEDCCRPDRPEENPAVLKAGSDSARPQIAFALPAGLTQRLFAPIVPALTSIPHTLGFPDHLTNRPLTIALLI